MAGAKAKGGKKGRKHGRNSAFCQRYQLENRYEKNKAKRQARHVRRVEKKRAKLAKRAAMSNEVA